LRALQFWCTSWHLRHSEMIFETSNSLEITNVSRCIWSVSAVVSRKCPTSERRNQRNGQKIHPVTWSFEWWKWKRREKAQKKERRNSKIVMTSIENDVKQIMDDLGVHEKDHAREQESPKSGFDHLAHPLFRSIVFPSKYDRQRLLTPQKVILPTPVTRLSVSRFRFLNVSNRNIWSGNQRPYCFLFEEEIRPEKCSDRSEQLIPEKWPIICQVTNSRINCFDSFRMGRFIGTFGHSRILSYPMIDDSRFRDRPPRSNFLLDGGLNHFGRSK
jgi:hypothetical protein